MSVRFSRVLCMWVRWGVGVGVVLWMEVLGEVEILCFLRGCCGWKFFVSGVGCEFGGLVWGIDWNWVI